MCFILKIYLVRILSGYTNLSLKLKRKSFKAYSETWDKYLTSHSHLKIMQSNFFLTLKYIFVLKIIKFFSCLFSPTEKRKVRFRNIRLILTFMISQSEKQAIVWTHCSISQEIKTIRQKNVVEILYTKCGRETIPRSFYQKIKTKQVPGSKFFTVSFCFRQKGRGGRCKKAPYQFFPCNFYKGRN